jgi:Helix-turn-helix domain
MHEAAEQIAEGRAGDMRDLALRLGYFDQAHFIRDFKAIVGRPPGQHRAASETQAGWAMHSLGTVETESGALRLLKEEFFEELLAVMLTGSHGTADQASSSDIDFLVVIASPRRQMCSKSSALVMAELSRGGPEGK